MREISRDDDMMDNEDALYVQFYMLPDKLILARDVAAQPARPTLTLNAQGLLFRDEVDSALSELWHPREYVVISDHHHRAILNSIRFDLQTGTVQPPLPDGVIDDVGLAPVIDRPVQHATPAVVIPDPVTKGLRGLKHAVAASAATLNQRAPGLSPGAARTASPRAP
ncbi:MAG: hypothetical protein E5Y51_01770 [Mesorhizobium sp.]|nr:MAG: hypothetical protein E5Y51_01770 [Mesorhizobium sp.]